ncbi:MAG: heparan-alpha-glucosaminide N-acetyltransferase domain-containing protein [Candidatus Lokiarchaeia archaeon]|nr:heparan-alpha-glucosaminide N-acetyltransferase domain-containing protein [Candidatus Lokiarchaeia archaeon]
MSMTIEEEFNNKELKKNTSRRIASIDFVKGFALVWIILAHAAVSWLDSDWVYIYGLVFAFMDVLGPSLFVFLSALSVVFSLKRKKELVSNKAVRNGIFIRGGVIILIGVLFNPMSLLTARVSMPFPLNLWGWNILMFIGFSQIFSYYAIKFSKTTRAIIAILIIYFSPWIRDLLYEFKDVNIGVWILHFLITSPLPQVPFLPYLAVCFMSTIFGEFLYEAMIKGTKKAYYKLFRIFLIYGIVFVLLGLFIIVPRGVNFNIWEYGLARVVPGDQTAPGVIVRSEYLHIDLLQIANMQNYYHFNAMPIFMVRCTGQDMFYNLGVAFVLIAICFYFFDIKKKTNDVIKLLLFYGKTSLSLFLIQYLFLPLYSSQFSIMFYPIVWVGYCGFLGLLMYIWLKFFGGVGTPEWIVRKIAGGGKRKKKS